jgi:hypothetical protein
LPPTHTAANECSARSTVYLPWAAEGEAPTGTSPLGDQVNNVAIAGVLLSLLTVPALSENQRTEGSASSAARIAEEARVRELAIERAPKDTCTKVMGRSLTLTEGSPKHAEDFADQIDAVYDWLEDAFPNVGTDRYARGPLLHVCKTYEQRDMRRDEAKSDRWEGTSFEIVVCRGNWGKASNEFKGVSQRAMEIWFAEKDPELFAVLPSWLRSGLTDLLADSRAKRGELDYKEDDGDREKLRIARREDRMETARDMFRMTRGEFRGGHATHQQAGRLLQMLISGKAKPRKESKELLERYVRNLKLALHDAGAESHDYDDEDAQQGLLDDAFERTFRNWSERDWKQFEKSFTSALR